MKVTKIDQISVFIEDAAGRLEEMTGVIGRAGINISAISVVENAGYGIVRMVISDTQGAIESLRNSDFMVKVTQVISIEIPDEPAALSKVLSKLSKEGINIKYMYGYSRDNVAPMILKVSDPDLAIKALG